jgi:myo-inositol 2-dehydrogenase / D-chiro-inositol 1-dehydrogenase
MRLGVLGVGRIGAFHARTVCTHPEVTATVLFDPQTDRAHALAESLGATVASSAAALLSQVDGVLIAASTSAHAELLELAVLAGVPVFCEKPVTLDLASTRRLGWLAAERNAVVQVGFQRRFDVGYRAAREHVLRGALGRVYTVRMAGHDPAPPHEAYLPTSGGIFRDLHIHDFDILRWVIGQEIDEVYMQGAVLVDEMFARHDDVDTVVGTLRCRDGTLGVLTGGRHDPLGYDIRMELLGSLDSVAVGWDARTPLRSLEPHMPPAPTEAYHGFLDRFDPAYQAEVHHFIDIVAGRAVSPCTMHDAEQALLVALACDRSRVEHRAVFIAEVQQQSS